MIKDVCFTEEWLDQFKKKPDHRRIDKIVLEKMIYALHLVERLKANGLDFVFKGGTSLVLLLEKGNRFSIDIDIISLTSREEFEARLNEVIESSRFTEWKLDERRSYLPGVPKAHYKFSFDSRMQGSGTILLDVLIEKTIYPVLIDKPVLTQWIETDMETMVTLPSIESITGDKLTAFAPNTIGIPYFKGKDNQPFSMEICKQLFDLGNLFERIENVGTVAESFNAFAKQEITYRKGKYPDFTLTPEAVLQDTVDTCLIIAKRGGGTEEEKKKFMELQKGIKAFDFGFLMTGSFRLDDAVSASARIAYLTARLMLNDLSPIAFYTGQDMKEWNIDKTEYNFLNRLKKLPDKSAFYYWYQTVMLLP